MGTCVGVAGARAAAAEADRRRTKAILGRIEREEAINATDPMHLTTLRRWTGIAKAPAVAELVKNDLKSVSKIVMFAVHREAIKRIADAIGPVGRSDPR